MKRYIVAMLLCIATLALANEWPFVEGMKVNVGTGPVVTDRVSIKPLVVSEPVWMTLERMTTKDRKNSEISVELEPNATQQALDMAKQIENLWNSGKYEEALNLFPELAKITDASKIAIGNSWRTPVPTYTQSKWGHDVRVGNRDSVLFSVLDIHRASGNLFAVLHLQGDGNTERWDVYLSTNGGQTWSETYDWWANFPIDIGATVLSNHIYISYAHQIYGRIRRCRASNGTPENFNNGQAFINVFTTTGTDSVNETALTGNQDFFNNRLYYVSMTKQRNLVYYWSDTAAISWTQVNTGVTNADRGLSASCNEGFANYFLLASYIVQGDTLHIDGRSTSWVNLARYYIGTSTDYTAVGGYQDTIISVFDFHGPLVVHCRYLTNYSGGTGTWYYGNVGGDTTTTAESPGLTTRAGGGTGIAYRYYTPTRQERYTWRRYVGGWSVPALVSDYEPYWNQPGIEYLGSSLYGVVYESWTTPTIRGAYFDRSDWIGIEEEKTQSLTSIGRLAPNPTRLLTNLSYALKKGGNVKIALYDVTGRVAKTLVNTQMNAGEHGLRIDAQNLPAGVYFVRMETPDGISSTPMTIVK